MKIVVALGGNALGSNLPEQRSAIQITVKAIANLIAAGNEVVIVHGNGPQVGLISKAMSRLTREELGQDQMPLSVCGAMSQAYIGFDLQNALREELRDRGIHRPVVSLVTQVCVDRDDPKFLSPSKPIGSFMSREEAEALRKSGVAVMEDAGRGWRKVVASPKPVDIVEMETIRTLVDRGQVVIACGGGGIPVIQEGNHAAEVDAVIDKDLAAAKLAQLLDAEELVILTAVEKVAVNFNKPDQKWLSHLTVAEAHRYIEEGQFAKGSMLPKIEAAIEFAVSGKGRRTLITLLEKAEEGLAGHTGTVITAEDA